MSEKTVAERLDAIVAKLAPKALDSAKKNGGKWPQRVDDPRPVRFERETAPGVWEVDKTLTAKDVGTGDPKGAVRQVDRGLAPYELRDVPGGGRRVLVYGDDGSTTGGLGATTSEAVADLEQKLGLAKKETK
jgi:hypothetical protein